MYKQIFDIKPMHGIDIPLSNALLRKYSKGAYKALHTTNYDQSREKLDFEIVTCGKIIPLNKNYNIPARMADILKKREIQDPNERWYKAKLPVGRPRYRTIASIIIGGTAERMRELAFGNQLVNYEIESDMDNSLVKRQKTIENWAVDVYNYIAKEFGEENILSFIVHLDEKNPHVHCMIIPISECNKISWKSVFGGNKYESISRFRHLNDSFALVSKKYGMTRGEDIKRTGASHKDYYTYLKEENRKLKEENKLLKEKLQRLNVKG